MAHDVEFSFEDNRVQVNAAFDDAISAFLLEASAEIVSHAAQHSPVDEGHLKGSWAADVNESKAEATVGSPLENAIWNEFGTGEYAAKKNGRKGYWVYVKDSASGSSKNTGKSYTLEEAKRIMARLRSKGLEAYYTKGKKPQRTLENAFAKNKGKLQRRAEQILKEKLGD